jgi:hypothetical protein
MNCFNIRELQSVLKRKFFTDLANTHDHRDLLEQSMIGLRYKVNNDLNLNSDILSFYNFGISTNNLNKILLFYGSNAGSNTLKLREYDVFFLNFFNMNGNFLKSFSLLFYINNILDYLSLIFSFNLLFFPFFSIKVFFNTLLSNINFFFDFSNFYHFTILTNPDMTTPTTFIIEDTNYKTTFIKNTFLESSLNMRYNRFFNLLVSYDYKTGHYMGN